MKFIKTFVVSLFAFIASHAGAKVYAFDQYFSQKAVQENLKDVQVAKDEAGEADYLDASWKLRDIKFNAMMLEDSAEKRKLSDSIEDALKSLDNLNQLKNFPHRFDRARKRIQLSNLSRELNSIEDGIKDLNDLDGVMKLSQKLPFLVQSNQDFKAYTTVDDMEQILEGYPRDEYLRDALHEVKDFEEILKFSSDPKYMKVRKANDLVVALRRLVTSSYIYNGKLDDDPAEEVNGQYGYDSDFSYRNQVRYGRTALYPKSKYETKRVDVSPKKSLSAIEAIRIKAKDDRVAIEYVTIRFINGDFLTIKNLKLTENQSYLFELKGKRHIKAIDVRAISSSFPFGTKARVVVFGVFN